MNRSIRNRIQRVLTHEVLDPRLLLATDSVYISEFLANNDSVLADEDGEFSDWIELHNPTDEPVDLAGWYLTDDRDLRSKWAFPIVQIPAHGFQIIFASGKDRRRPMRELHTNFKLASDGEYLALVKSDQSTAHEFASYPPQTSDVAFGSAVHEIPLVDGESIRSFRVPDINDVNQAEWRGLAFDDRSWRSSSGPIGYDERVFLENAGFERDDLSRWGSRGSVDVIAGESLQLVPSEGRRMALATTRGSTATRGGVEFYLNLPRGTLDSVNTGGVQRVSALTREVSVDAGSELTLDWNFLTNDVRDGDFAFASIADTDPTSLLLLADPLSGLVESAAEDYARETGLCRFSHVFETAGTYTIAFGIAQAHDLEHDSALVIDNLQLDGAVDSTWSYNDVIETDIAEELSQRNSVWWRKEFTYDSTLSANELVLRVRYDDGFAAFINGDLVASRNAPDTLEWDASATRMRPNYLAIEFEEIQIPASVLKSGANMLAIQGLNNEVDMLDFLLDAELVGIADISDEPAFLLVPTPGERNLSASIPDNGVMEKVTFSHSHGFHTSPFLLTMSTGTPDATIRYTTDGSRPTERAGEVYDAPIPINSTTIVRAAAFKNAVVRRDTTTASFIFLEDVLEQSTVTATAAGFPATWPDYEMDPNVIGADGQDAFDGKYTRTIRDDLLSLPTISLALDGIDLFGDRGIFDHPTMRGEDWERATSVELIDPGGTEGFQVDAGLRIHGGVSRTTSDKLSMRLAFRDRYGDGKLRYPLFGSSGPTEFDGIVLRSSSGEAIPGFHYIRDETLRRISRAAGNPSAMGTFVHVYVNGLYWGVYNPTERIDAQFAVNRDGGTKEDYDIYDSGDLLEVSPIQGTTEAWNRLVSLSEEIAEAANENERTAALMKLEGRNANGSNNAEIESYLDVDNFIDYLVLNVYAGNSDWPIQNYYTYRKRGRDSEGFKFSMWDAEFTFDAGTAFSRTTRISDLDYGVTAIVEPLLKSEAFRVRFADRVHELFSPGGALYVNPQSPEWDPNQPENNMPASVYAEVADSVYSAMVAESARWGDQRAQQDPPFTRDEDWTTVVTQNLTEFFPRRSALFLDQLRDQDLYRDPPTFALSPGQVAAGSSMTLTSPGDTPIYYTTNGSDPRLPSGDISPLAMRYTTEILLSERMLIRARSLDGMKWSAIDGGLYWIDEPPASRDNLRITEVHYHPEPNGEAEFLELTNIGTETIRLDGVVLEGGIRFEFTQDDQVRLSPGERLVLVRDREAFVQIYPDRENSVAGQYEGNLSNGGEELRLLAADGTTIQRFEYQDDGDWPSLPDGSGPSLQLIAATLDARLGSSWRPSAVVGGTPGQPEYRAGDANLDGMFNSSDLVQVFQRGDYEDAVIGNSRFADGDWNGDGDFTTSDLVLAFESGHYIAAAWPTADRIATAIDWLFDGGTPAKVHHAVPKVVNGRFDR